MSYKDLVSIVIPNYNSERYIRQTIDSVRNQTYPNWELIIVDDKSTDRSVEIINEYTKDDPRISLIQLESNSGLPAVPRNVGIKAAKGKYVGFLDADDLWHPQKLELQIGFMERNSARFTSTNIYNFRDIKNIQPFLNTTYDGHTCKIKKINHANLLLKNVIPASTVVIERGLLIKNKFNEDPRYKAIEDYQRWLYMHQRDIDFSYKLRCRLAFYRLSDTSISKSKLSMLRKNYMLYSEYLIAGKPLGMSKFRYLFSYVYRSFLDRILRNHQ